MGKCELSKNVMYDDAHVNVLEEALPFQANHKIKGIEGNNNNQRCRSYKYVDSIDWFKLFPFLIFFRRIREHVITKCPCIHNERDGFVKHVGQQMLGINFV